MSGASSVPFPMVVGCGRSGTTLVRAILNAHPDLAVPDESYFPVWLGRKRAEYERAGGFALEAFLTDVIAHEWFQRWGLDDDEVRARLRSQPPDSFADAVRALFALYAEANGKSRYGDKTPAYVEHIPMLAEMFPEAIFIQVVRDGRAVALSRMAAAWSTDRLDHEALLWRSQVMRGRADGTALVPNRYCEIHYEDLLERPQLIARSLCDFIGLEYTDEMLRYHEGGQDLVATLKFPDEHQNLVRPPTKGLREWRTELSGRDIALFDELAGDALVAFGYECDRRRTSADVRARATLARSRYATVRMGKRARSYGARVLGRA